MLVTTAYKPNDKLIYKSKQLAEDYGFTWVPRGNDTTTKLHLKYGKQPVLILTSAGWKYIQHDCEPLFFHPSTAVIRLKRLLKQQSDVMIAVSGAQLGDEVIDCTAGLATDSIVFSHIVGFTGKVTAIESSIVLCLILKEGLQAYHSDLPALNAAMRKIQVIGADHLHYLKQLPEDAVDIIYFDPMFRRPIMHSKALSPLREIANVTPLDEQAVREACRVARKTVVMKEHRDSTEFARLGFEVVHRSYSKIAYGVIHC